MFIDGPDLKSSCFLQGAQTAVSETAVLFAADLESCSHWIEGMPLHLGHGFSTSAPLTFGLDSPLLWRTIL